MLSLWQLMEVTGLVNSYWCPILWFLLDCCCCCCQWRNWREGAGGVMLPLIALGSPLAEKGAPCFEWNISIFSGCIALSKKQETDSDVIDRGEKGKNLCSSQGFLAWMTINNFVTRPLSYIFSFAAILICYNVWLKQRLTLGYSRFQGPYIGRMKSA